MNSLPVGLAISFAIGSLLYVTIRSSLTEDFLKRCRSRLVTRHDALSPTHLSSSEKENSFVNSTSPLEYADVFPPHRRPALADLLANCLTRSGKSGKELSELPPDYTSLTSDKVSSDIDAVLEHTTATGFTVREIRQLGDFPDYATLSGVPLPQPCKEFNINTAIMRPYRPYRWPYYQTMSLFRLDTDYWLELDRNYVETIKQRQKLFRKYGSLVLQSRLGSELATKETMEICLQFLCARYPRHFRIDKENMAFHNSLLHSTTDLRSTDPLHVLLDNVPEDFAIMIRDPETGIYSCRAGMIMSSLGWNLGNKIGMKLHEIHGPVPQYKDKMQFSMDRYFAKMPTDKPIQRGSWGFEIDQPLYMSPGDPDEKLREIQEPNLTIDRCHLRVDWQTLRRLPLSGAIVFNFKGVFTPVTEFRDEPYIPSLILKVLRDGNKDVMKYKNTWYTEHAVIPALEEYEREQVETGLIEKDWEPKTLDESPFYPGWEQKRRRQQEF